MELEEFLLYVGLIVFGSLIAFGKFYFRRREQSSRLEATWQRIHSEQDRFF